MANALYAKGRQGFLGGDLAWDTDTIKVVLIDTAAYTVNLAIHTFLSEVPVASRVATSAALAAKTITDGVADAADITIPAVTGPSVEALIIFQDTTVETTSRLIAWFDTATGTPGLPFTPNGTDLNITWDNGANRIFRL